MSDDRVILRVECDGCDDVGQTTRLEHPDGSQQEKIFREAHEQIVEEHREETGHDVELSKEVKDAN